MSLIWSRFRVPCKPIHLFTPTWRQRARWFRGSIEASTCLSCSVCVGQQVSEEPAWSCFSVNTFGFSPVRMNPKWLQPICVGAFGNLQASVNILCVYVRWVWQHISEFPWLRLDWQWYYILQVDKYSLFWAQAHLRVNGRNYWSTFTEALHLSTITRSLYSRIYASTTSSTSTFFQ